MKYLPVSVESLEQAAKILRSGGLVAFPTETVYGLGADAFNKEAVAKVFEAKSRPHFDPLIIHIASVETLEKTADMSLLNEGTRKKLFLLVENLWPGPLSIVLPKNEKIPGIVTAGLPTAAVRFPNHEAAQKLISLSSGAVAAPSANLFGSLSPTRAEHVRGGLEDKVDMILDGGPAKIGIESTVLDISGDCIKILRPGGTPKEAIEKLIGSVYDSFYPTGKDNFPNNSFTSPGQLKSHYAPKTPLFTFTTGEIISLPCEKDAAYLFFDDSSRAAWQKTHCKTDNYALIKVLSPSGRLSEAASCLFDVFHAFDSAEISRIYAQFVPQEGLGVAINDRLTRAQSVH
jgi:L-threonylcarbamoyladenylate synthase